MKEFFLWLIAVIVGFAAFVAFYFTVALIVMAFWGVIFVAFDWVFPGVIYAVVPHQMTAYSPFQIGGLVGFVVMIAKAMFSTSVSVNNK